MAKATNPFEVLFKEDRLLADAFKRSRGMQTPLALRIAIEKEDGQRAHDYIQALVNSGMRPRDAVSQLLQHAIQMGFNTGRAFEQAKAE